MNQPDLPSQTPPAYLARRPVLRFLHQRWQNWRARHQLPFNFAVHLIGIPLAFAGLGVLLAAPFTSTVEWYWGIGGLVVGYLLQYLGHRAEGNDVGEWAGIKHLFGLPYVGISPRWQKPQ
jgi:Protein of unknown function (DUF962)